MKTENSRLEHKKNKIFSTTIRLFQNNDIKKVTMDEISSEAHVSKVTVYKYFGDKESLYRHVSEKLLQNYIAELKSRLQLEMPINQKMINCIMVLVDFMDKGYADLCNSLSALNDDADNQYKEFNINVREIIMSLIEAGKENGLIREDISNECIYHYIDMGLNYFANNQEYRGKILKVPSFRKEFMTFMWSNIFVDYSGFNY